MLSSVLPHRFQPSGRKETLGVPICPTNQLHVGVPFRRFKQSFAFATALRFARHPGRPDQVMRLAYGDFALPSSLCTDLSASSGICYGAKLRIAPAGLSPASSTARFAAPFLRDFHPLHIHQLDWRTPPLPESTRSCPCPHSGSRGRLRDHAPDSGRCAPGSIPGVPEADMLPRRPEFSAKTSNMLQLI